jgi:hypothetical protein
MIAAVVMVAFLSVLAVASIVWLPPLHPAQLWLIPWAIAAGLYLIRLLPYRRLGVETVVLVCGSSLAFVLGSLVGQRIGARLPRLARRSESGLGAVRWAAIGALGLTALLLCGFLAQVALRYGLRPTLISTQTVRDAIGLGQFSVTIKYVYAALAATALCATVAAREPKPVASRWKVACLLAIASVYFSTGRATLVVAMLVGAVAYVLARARPLSRARFLTGCVAVAVLALLVFVVGGNLIGKTYENNPGLQAVPSVFADHPRLRVVALPYEYTSAPIAGLDVQVAASTVWGTSHGCAAFVEPCRILERLGVSGLEPVPRIRPFTKEPLPWNTYTALDIPLMDGGLILAVPLIGLLGCALGVLWAAARRRSPFAVSAYALLASALVAASGSFNFTAPHIVGAVCICGVALAGGLLVTRMKERPTAALGEA